MGLHALGLEFIGQKAKHGICALGHRDLAGTGNSIHVQDPVVTTYHKLSRHIKAISLAIC